MDEYRPQTAEGNKPRNRVEIQPKKHRRQGFEPARVDIVERVFAVGGDVIDMLRSMVHAVEAPEERKFMLRAVPPVDTDIAKQYHAGNFDPRWQTGQRGWREVGLIHVGKERPQYKYGRSIKNERLPQVECEVVQPIAAQPGNKPHRLSPIGTPEMLKGQKDETQRRKVPDSLREVLKKKH